MKSKILVYTLFFTLALAACKKETAVVPTPAPTPVKVATPTPVPTPTPTPDPCAVRKEYYTFQHTIGKFDPALAATLVNDRASCDAAVDHITYFGSSLNTWVDSQLPIVYIQCNVWTCSPN